MALLRHELMFLRRQVTRPRYERLFDWMLAMLAKLPQRERWSVLLVTPATLLRWRHELLMRLWTRPATGRGQQGRRPILLLTWWCGWRGRSPLGYLTIVGACRKLAILVSGSPCAGSFAATGWGRHRGAGPSWTAFLRAQGAPMLACDFLSVESVGLNRLYVLFAVDWTGRRSGASWRRADSETGSVLRRAGASVPEGPGCGPRCRRGEGTGGFHWTGTPAGYVAWMRHTVEVAAAERSLSTDPR
jgi:putative transposase